MFCIIIVKKQIVLLSSIESNLFLKHKQDSGIFLESIVLNQDSALGLNNAICKKIKDLLEEYQKMGFVLSISPINHEIT